MYALTAIIKRAFKQQTLVPILIKKGTNDGKTLSNLKPLKKERNSLRALLLTGNDWQAHRDPFVHPACHACNELKA